MKVVNTLQLIQLNKDAVRNKYNRAIADEGIKRLDLAGYHILRGGCCYITIRKSVVKCS
jgi:hypothetical protein